MSRVNASTLVGNDIVVGINREIKAKRPVEARRRFVFPETPEEEHQSPPIQNFSTLAFNAPAVERTPFVIPSARNYSLGFFSKARITAFVIILSALSLSAVAIANRQQVVALSNRGVSLATQAIQNVAGHKTAAAPAVNPRQLIIHSSDYDAAMTDLITQQITLNVGGSSQTVNATAIANWLNVKNQGSLTFISVNTSALTTYLNQLVNGGDKASYSQSAFNQIANNLLKAKGMTLTLSATT